MNDYEILFSLIRYSLFGGELRDCELTDETARNIIGISARHDIAQLVSHAVANAGIRVSADCESKLKMTGLKSFARCSRMENTLARLCELFENAGIDFVPLKGAVLRALYPESWMRTSCDIDLLVHDTDIDPAIKMLMSEGYTVGESDYHCVSLTSPDNVRLELHHSIRGKIDSALPLLDSVWEHTLTADGGKHRKIMTDEYLVFYLVAHMANHFRGGGCGIRPFIDFGLALSQLNADTGKTEAMLKEAKLYDFYTGAKRLTEVWLYDSAHDELTREMQEYVISGGSYGTLSQLSAVQQIDSNGKSRLFVRRLFPPLEQMRRFYPALQKSAALLPAFWAYRIIKLPFDKKMKIRFAEAKTICSTSSRTLNRINDMMGRLGL